MKQTIAAILILILILVGVGILFNSQDKTEPAELNSPSFTEQEIRSLAEIWAEALKTRDGEPRYEIMSERLQQEFMEEQKLRSTPWNFNIGVSSPWVTDYEITTEDDSAEILYHMTDSTQGKYAQREIIYFGKENGKTVVTDVKELLSDGELHINASTYEFDSLLYLSPLSSMTFDYAKDKFRYSIYTKDGQKTNHYLFSMDGQLWLSSYADNTADKSEITMHIWKLRVLSDEI